MRRAPARSIPLLLSASLLAFPLPGCLEFEQQEVRVVVDAERDRVDLMLVYRGLCSGPPHFSWRGGEDVKGTEETLDELQAGRQIGALLAPMMFFDLTELAASEDPLYAAFASRVAIDHGEPFRTEDGRLCAWQLVHVGSLTEVLRMADLFLARSIAKESDARDFRQGLGCDDAESRERIRVALEKGEPWFGVVGSTLAMHVPASETAARSLARRIAEAPSSAGGAAGTEVDRRALEGMSDAEELAVGLRAIGVRAVVTARGIDLLLGDPDAAMQRIDVRTPSKSERFDLAPRLEARRIRIRDDVTEATLAAEFASFRDR
jgi:hypothetical protein